MKIDRVYILAGFVWLILGMVFGIYLGGTSQFQFANAHAHANLIGFVISVLFGPIYRSWPDLQGRRLAWPQFAVYELGAILLVAGKYQIDSGQGGGLTAPGAILTILGTVLIFWLFATIKDTPPPKPGFRNDQRGTRFLSRQAPM